MLYKKQLRAQLLVWLSSVALAGSVGATDIPTMTPGTGTGGGNSQAAALGISATSTIDLSSNGGFVNIVHGKDVVKNTASSGTTYNAMFQEQYGAPAQALKAANTALDSANAALSGVSTSDPGYAALQAAVTNAQNEKDTAQAAYDTAFGAGNVANVEGKLYIPSDQAKDLTKLSDAVSYTSGIPNYYIDPVTGQAISFTVNKNYVYNAGDVQLNGAPSIEYYDKMPESGANSQYDDMTIANISGVGTTVTISGDKTGPNGNNELTAISKDSGMFNVKDGANLTIDSYISYKTGSGSSVSQPYTGDGTSSTSIHLEQITWAGPISTPFGTFTVTDAASANAYNAALIAYIKDNENFRLSNNAAAVQAFYNAQIAKMYSVTKTVDATGTYTWAQETIDNIPVLDPSDIGLKPVSNNYFIGVTDSNSTITLTAGSTIDSNDSGGTVIRANFTNSGTSGNNTINIDGTIKGAATAVDAKNANVNISATGNVGSAILLDTGTITNSGTIANASIANGTFTNNNGANAGAVAASNNSKVDNAVGATITGGITGDNSEINNNGSVVGNITGSNGASITNTGSVTGAVGGNNSTIVNTGTAGSVWGSGNSKVTNDNQTLVGTQILSLSGTSEYTGTNGDYYIGYDRSTYTPGSGVVPTELASGVDNAKYNGIISTGAKKLDISDSRVYLASTTNEVNGITLTGDTKYTDTVNTSVTSNAANNSIPVGDLQEGNANNLFYVYGTTNPITINSTINMNDLGSVGIRADHSANVIYAGTMNLNSIHGADGTILPSFGIRSDGSSDEIGDPKTTITLKGTVNINADRGIGIHVRDGGTVIIDDGAAINFSAAKKNQIGVLLSGVTNESNLIYQNTNPLVLQGDGSVLFRVERGAKFDTANVGGGSTFYSSNNTNDSALFVVTNGPVAAGANNQSVLNVDNATLEISGNNSTGIRAEGGAIATLEDGNTISVAGTNNSVGIIDGHYYELDGSYRPSYNGNTVLTNKASITNANYDGTVDSGSVGFHAKNGGQLTNVGSIDFTTTGNDLIGVLLTDGGKLLTESGSSIKVDGTAVKIDGANSVAIVNTGDNDPATTTPVVYATNGNAAYWVTNNAKLELTGKGETMAGGTAHGILIDGASQISMTGGAYINMNIAGSTGSGIENKSGLENITFQTAKIDVKDGIGIHSAVGFAPSNGVQSGVINVFGSGTGIRFENMDGTTTDNAITFTNAKDLVVNVKEATGKGIYVNSSKDVTTSGSVNILSATGGAALIVDGTTANVTQQGNLHSASSNNIVQLNSSVTSLTNSGDITYGTFADPTSDIPTFTRGAYTDTVAIAQGPAGDQMTFTNASGGVINGGVSLLRTSGNIVNLNAGSIGNVFVTGDGKDTFNVNSITGSDADAFDHQFRKIDGGAGDDVLNLIDSNYTVTKAGTISNVETINLKGSDATKGTILTLDKVLPNGSKVFDVSALSALKYNINADTIFEKTIQNSGLVLITGTNTPANTFEFKYAQMNFNGTFELNNVKYALDNEDGRENQTSLYKATLKGSSKSQVIVGLGTQIVGNVYMNGGNFDFANVNFDDAVPATPGRLIADHNIKTTDLTLNGGTVTVGLQGSVVNPVAPPALAADKVSLLAQDDTNRNIQLVQAQSVATESGGAPKVVDALGNPLASNAKVDITQNSEAVARATYGVGTSVVTNKAAASYENGLYLTSGLLQIELKAIENSGGNALRLNTFGNNTNVNPDASTLTAKLTDFDNGDGTYTAGIYNNDGTKTIGDVVITGSDQVILDNSLNDYQGRTIIDADASLKSASDHSFGKTSELNLTAASSKVDINGKSESIGALNTVNTASVNINGGNLTITKAQDLNNVQSLVSGDGVLTSDGGTLNVMARASVGEPVVTDGAVVTVTGSNTGLSAAINNYDASTIHILQGDSLGTGAITLSDTSQLLTDLDHDATMTNTFTAGSADAFVNKVGQGMLTFNNSQAAYEGTTNLQEGAIRFSGGTVASNTINASVGTLLRGDDDTTMAGSVNNAGTFTTGSNVVIQKALANTGSVYVGNTASDTVATSNTLFTKDYVGTAGSSLYFNGALNNDASVINKLVISDSSSGTSDVYVKNLGGRGAYTEQGILLIETLNNSNAEYVTPTGSTFAGAYEYKLQRGTRQGENLNNYYLVSKLAKGPSAYYATYAATQEVLDLRFQDRLGSKDFTGYAKGDDNQQDAIWARMVTSKREEDDNGGENHIRNTGSYMQIGYDVVKWANANSRRQAGVMFGYYTGSGVVQSIALNDSSAMSMKNDLYTAGLYHSWVKDLNEKNSFYIDTWAQYLWGTNKVTSTDFNQDYKTKGFAASIEAGYTHVYKQTEDKANFVEPKLQLIFNNIKQDSFQESGNGILYQQDSRNQFISRLGIRLGDKSIMVPGKTAYASGYVELNWLHYFNYFKFSVGENNLQFGIKDKAEVRFGFERQYSKNASIWGYGYLQAGAHSYTNIGVQLGAKYSF